MKESEKKIFVDLVFNNMDIIYKICSIYSHRNDKDLHQDIIYQLWKSYPSYQKKAKFQTWMYKVALNTALLQLRGKKNAITEIPKNEYIFFQEESDMSELSEKIKLLYFHISKLNEIEKAIIFLYLEQCSYQEISQITGLSEKNISVKLVRIRKKLRKMFKTKKA